MSQHLSDAVFAGGAKITGLPAATANGQPVVFEQLNAAVEGLAWKDSARVATQANLNLASPGATIDGVTMATNDRVLVRAQTTGSENGIYIWNGAAVAMTRSLDASTFDELESAVVTVDEGTSAGASFRQTAVNGTIGSTTVTWSSFGTGAPAASTTTAGIAEIATQAEVDAGTVTNMFVTPETLAAYSGRLRKFSALVGDGSATQFTVSHNFNTRQVLVDVIRESGQYDTVEVDIERTGVNTVRVTFAQAPASNAFRVVVIG